MNGALGILDGVFKTAPNLQSHSGVTSALLILNGKTYPIKNESDANKLVSEFGAKSVTAATVVLSTGSDVTQVVVGAEMLNDEGNIKKALSGQGLSAAAFERVKKDYLSGAADAFSSCAAMFQWDGKKFTPISLDEATKCSFDSVVTVLYPSKGNLIVCAANQSLADRYGYLLLGDSSKVQVQIMDQNGGVRVKDFTPSSKSGFAVVLRGGGHAALGTAFATLIAIFTALTFNLIAFLIAVALIVLGTGSLIAYEKLADNPA